MYGAILGDIIGSTYEYAEIKYKNFELFPMYSKYTDDSIMTIAVQQRRWSNGRKAGISSRL